MRVRERGRGSKGYLESAVRREIARLRPREGCELLWLCPPQATHPPLHRRNPFSLLDDL